jgi:glycosyltransferase involved in cell wall biosynthesis
MRILVAHVNYRERGGEDAVVDTESRLLRESGHEVAPLIVPSEQFRALSRVAQLTIGARFGNHRHGRLLIRDAVEHFRPDVVHFHNLYPSLGPGAMGEASRLGCATVQTYHNYRLSCIAGTHFRANSTCDLCAPGRVGAGVVRGCYRSSALESAAMATGVSRQWRALREAVVPDVGICLTDFMRSRLLAAGAPPDALVVKPNSVADSKRIAGWADREGAVFVGRLSAEKGIAELVSAWPSHAPMLTVVGAGPLEASVAASAKWNVAFLGHLSNYEVRRHLAAARVCVVPSACLEGLPTTALEAFAEGTPVVGFDLGAMSAVLAHQGDGMAAKAGDFGSLCRIATHVMRAPEEQWSSASRAARAAHAERYDHASNVRATLSVYARALGRRQERG